MSVNKKRFITALISACMMFSAFLPACAGGAWKAEDFVVPAYDESLQIDIMPWWAPVGAVQNQVEDPKYWKLAADAGYNVVHAIHLDMRQHASKVGTYLGNAKAAGLKIIIKDGDWVNADDHGSNLSLPSNDKNAKFYENDDAFYGIFINDEGEKKHWNDIKDKFELSKERFPGKTHFANTCRFTRDDNQWYQDVSDYITTVKPSLFSYDWYAMMADGTTRPDFISTMATARYAVQDAGGGIPAWNTLLTTGSNTSSFANYRKQSYEDILWQSMTTMAYGYHGLAHYMYGVEEQNGKPNETFDRMINDKGEPTELYFRVQRANLGIRKWDHVYKSFEWKGTVCIEGKTANPEKLIRMILPQFRNRDKLSDMDGVTALTASQDVLAGIFKDAEGRGGCMISSAVSPALNLDTAVELALDKKKYQAVAVYDNEMTEGEPQILPLSGKGVLKFTLAPGAGKFLIPLTKNNNK